LHISGKFYLENLVLVGVSTHVPSSTHLTNLIVLGQALSMDAIVNVVSNNITAEATLNDLHLALFYLGSESNHMLWAGGY
jgi:hypothetical protein